MFLRYCLAVMLGSCAAVAPARAADIQVVSSGKNAGTVEAYHAGGVYYLNAKEAGSLYGGQVAWYPVTGRVRLSVRGKEVQFLINSDRASIGSKIVRMAAPVVARTSRAFIPMSFFLSKEFCDLLGVDTEFDPRTRLLTLDQRSNVSAPRWFTDPGHTRVELDVDEGLRWSASGRGSSGVEISVPFGKIEGSERIEVEDGIVRSMDLRQEPRAVRLAILFEAEGVQWRSHETRDPRRVVLDFYAKVAAKSVSSVPAIPPTVEASTAPMTVPASKASSPPTPLPAARLVPAAAAASLPSERPEPRLPRVVVDAGHGGKDSGAVGWRGIKEKDLNLSAAKDLAALLRKEGGFDVLLIRDDDTFVPLDERSQRANDFDADLFVSLHCNASTSRSEEGLEIYFLSEHASDPESQRVADAENSVLRFEGKSNEELEAQGVLHAMAKTEYMNDGSVLAGLMGKDLARRVDIHNRGVKQAAFYVLRGTDAPAVLVEMGFVTNAQDAARLSSKRFRHKLIEGLYTGIVDFGRRHGWHGAEE